MNDNVSLQEMINTLEQAPAPVAPTTTLVKPEEDKEPEPFEFSKGRDLVGLPLEHASYARSRCRGCNGKGYIRLVIGDGYKPLLAGKTEREPRKAREQRACFCVNKGYVRVRREFERLAGRAASSLVIVKEALAAEPDPKVADAKTNERVLREYFPHLAPPQE